MDVISAPRTGDALPATTPRRRVPDKAVAIATLVVLALVIVVHLPFPFGVDQTFGAVFGNEIRHGQVLYKDVWDVRQPGWFAIFTLGGAFGADEFVVHLIEGALSLVFAVVLQRTLRPHVEKAWVAAVAPILVLGAYWAGAVPISLTQPESLIGFPMFVAIWAVTTRGPATTPRMIVAGLAGAAVVLLKLIYLPILAVVWVGAVIVKRGAFKWTHLATLLLAFVLPLAATVGYFAATGALGKMAWTFFQFPLHQRKLDLRDSHRLRVAAEFLAKNFVWLVPLAVTGVASRRRLDEPFVQAMLAWIGIGGVLLLLQTWYLYQFLLVTVPLGVLAVLGLDRIARWWPAHHHRNVVVLVVVVSVVLTFWPVRTLARKTASFASDKAGLTQAGRDAYHDKYAPEYASAKRETAFLRAPGAAPGPIHVFGNYELQRFSGRRMAIPINGFTPEQLDARLWRETRDDLASVKPPYIFISDLTALLLVQRAPATLAFIERAYCPARDTADGRWVVRRELGRCR
jgi:hypothetical protein